MKRTTNWLSLILVVAVSLVGHSAFAQSEAIPLGATMPEMDRSLSQPSGGQATLSSVGGSQGTVVVFWSNNCAWVDKYEDRLFSLADTYSGRGVGFVLVNSNDASAFPKESLEESAARAGDYPVPYLKDGGSAVARAFGAARTPHVYVFDGDDALVYVGAIDDSPGDPGNVSNAYLEQALEALLAGEPIPTTKTKAFGCTVKLN